MTPPGGGPADRVALARKGEEARRNLFAAPLRDFIHRRDALARELRGKGAMEEAKALANLRKPPVGLWIANQLARLAPAEVRALLGATARLRQGQSAAVRGASAEALREAMREQREALARLADAAGRAAVEAGTRLTPELQRRVQNTVQAAAASEPEALGEGRLEKELVPAGFEGLLAGAPQVREEPAVAARKRDDDAAAPERDRDDDAAGRARKKEEAAARAREKERVRTLHHAEREAQRLEAQAKKLAAIAAVREQEAAGARERAEAARRQADQAAARTDRLRGR